MPNSSHHTTNPGFTRPRERNSAPYGQACINCSRAKCKCILFSLGEGCERCTRLGKECRPSPTVRKRNKGSSSLRLTEVESKLDSLLSALQKTTGSSGVAYTSPDSGLASESDNSPQCHATETPSAAIPPVIQNSPTKMLFLAPGPSGVADKLLHQFRTENVNYLPFIYIPPHTTSQELARDKPFFWACLTAVLAPNLTERELLFTKIKDTIHQKLLIDTDPSLEILLGIMTFISWKTYSPKPFINFYSHLLMGLVSDLGINKAASKEQPIMQGFQRAAGGKTETVTSRTLKERRAVLGCFLITSSVASSLGKGDALRWTPHMEENLEILADTKECAEDEILVSLVRIQLVVDKVHHLRRDEDHSSTPVVMGLLKSQLNSAKSQIPLHLTHNSVIQLYHANAELVIHEIYIKTPTISHCSDPQGPKSLQISLQATKSWLDVWLAIPPEHYMAVSFTILFQFCRALINLYKLSTLDDPAWDKAAVQNTANLLHYLDTLHLNFQRASNHIHQAAEVNMFEKGAKMILSIKQRWAPLLIQASCAMPVTGAAEASFEYTADTPNALRLDGIDDAWMMEFLGSL
ncbi:hypothetical protein NUU61_005282 [Penicillium alfredii]|uniref:Zn(2)-C6 fungal-type domain-containing protein n=1 Tax=Penicillium alfredii TaxID=1506179 RepID=A0A9W9K808_9EURO|nr:uncharacterized protein NUU61_005282 [Penicillium alfredii]KAJ5095926.1 hypothetical protein NUU61_005282 [Penicillium alfredii]